MSFPAEKQLRVCVNLTGDEYELENNHVPRVIHRIKKPEWRQAVTCPQERRFDDGGGPRKPDDDEHVADYIASGNHPDDAEPV
jgi:hypothetical protein